jgi:hypothetical protein
MTTYHVVPMGKPGFKIEGRGHQTFEQAVKAAADQLGEYAICMVTPIAYSTSPAIQLLAEDLANA